MWSPNRAEKSIKTSTTNKTRRLSESSSERTSAESLKKSEADFQYLLEHLSVQPVFPSFCSEELDVKPEYIHFLFLSYHPSCPLIGGGCLMSLNKSCPGDPPPAVLKADGPTGPEVTEDGSAQECAASLRLHGSLRWDFNSQPTPTQKILSSWVKSESLSCSGDFGCWPWRAANCSTFPDSSKFFILISCPEKWWKSVCNQHVDELKPASVTKYRTFKQGPVKKSSITFRWKLFLCEYFLKNMHEPCTYKSKRLPRVWNDESTLLFF